MKIFLVLSLFLAHGQIAEAQTDFSGHWRGQEGEITMLVDGVEQGKTTCREFNFDIEQAAGRLDLNSIYAFCGASLEVDYSINNLVQQGNDLFLNGEKVGSLVNNLLRVDIGKGPNRLQAQFLVEGQDMHYNYEWTDGLNTLVISGVLGLWPSDIF